MNIKKCAKCNQNLSLDCFNNYKKSPDGKQGYCKICQRQVKKKSLL